jgi:alkanesulfonate monooxygenase SsuD/methylene tetrahydromethanopterin reductase-like flavin-dependent oxidoreductase (luciferase family)
MSKKVKFGARLSKSIFYHSPESTPYMTPQERVYWPLVREIAQECERLGFDSVILPDHPPARGYGSWSTLAAIAATTKTVKLGTLTTNTMRYLPNPSVFIHEVATLDNISDGRLYPLGLGTGYTEEEYKSLGFPFPPFMQRLGQLEETIKMMNLMFTEDKVTFKGKYFNIENLTCEPKPVQKPFPICVGGNGEKLLSLAAKYADHIDINNAMDMKEALQDKLNYIEKKCSEYGRNYNDIVKSCGCWFWIYEDEKEHNRYKAEFDKLRANREVGYDAVVTGTPEEIINIFKDVVEIGINYFTLRFEDLPSKRSLRLFAEHVLPHFK